MPDNSFLFFYHVQPSPNCPQSVDRYGFFLKFPNVVSYEEKLVKPTTNGSSIRTPFTERLIDIPFGLEYETAQV